MDDDTRFLPGDLCAPGTAEGLCCLSGGYERGVSILYITHDLLSARMLADQVIVLNGGRVVEQGPALDVIHHPRDDYTKLLLEAVPNPFAESPAA